jgi:hypothetical protein
MSLINSRDRNVRIVATAATILLGLTVVAAADAGGYHGHAYNNRDHRGEVAVSPAPKGTIDPGKAVVRDHRTSAGSGASAIPTGRK